MSFNDTLLECLKRLQKEIINNKSPLCDDKLLSIFYGKQTVNEEPQKVIIKKKRKGKKEPEVEPWRMNRFGKLYLKCKNTNLLYDPVTEECVGEYTCDFDSEKELIHLYHN
tara:strand:+ start:91 stop:423 length:333 start_codon:yes stop_codon:yes gene_type:complete